VFVAAVACPVGNRESMNLAEDRLDTFKRPLAVASTARPRHRACGVAGIVVIAAGVLGYSFAGRWQKFT